MLEEIHKDRKTVAQPSIDLISHDTFAFRHILPNSILLGVFDWKMNFIWTLVYQRENQRRNNDMVGLRDTSFFLLFYQLVLCMFV